MFKSIKSWTKKIGLAAVASLAIANANCELLTPDGCQVYKQADGIVTEKEEKNLIKVIELTETGQRDLLEYVDEKNRITDFESGSFQDLVNDINVHYVQEFEKQGLKFPRYGKDLHVYFAPTREDLIKENGLPQDKLAFFSSVNDTIYMPLSFKMYENYLDNLFDTNLERILYYNFQI